MVLPPRHGWRLSSNKTQIDRIKSISSTESTEHTSSGRKAAVECRAAVSAAQADPFTFCLIERPSSRHGKSF